jgi:16S rRNA (cytidine1402-2'-O)-methyltransferase
VSGSSGAEELSGFSIGPAEKPLSKPLAPSKPLVPNKPLANNKPLAPGLYLVATPIGNLEDITLRALRVLATVDRIACEDTRQTSKLLSHYGIATPTVSYHMHNERGRAEELVAQLQAGARIAVVSDAGTPGIADPGAAIATAALAAGIDVFAIPGANAALTALIASGMNAERFSFHGFLPSKSGQRRSALERLRAAVAADAGSEDEPPPTHIFYETPHRIVEALADVASVFGEQQAVVVGRELTKLHEEFLRGSVVDVLSRLKARDSIRGEMVLLLAPSAASRAGQSVAKSLAEDMRTLMREESLDEKDALKRVAKARSLGKSEAYREWQRTKR